MNFNGFQNLDFLKLLGWGWLHWLVLAVLVGVISNEIYLRQLNRIKVIDTSQIEAIEENITEYSTMAERLATLEVLPPVKEQWDYVVAIANKYGVDMRYVSSASNYRGLLNSWGGIVSGSTGPVLVVAKELQETVPTYLYGFTIDGDRASFEFAVLGSE